MTGLPDTYNVRIVGQYSAKLSLPHCTSANLFQRIHACEVEYANDAGQEASSIFIVKFVDKFFYTFDCFKFSALASLLMAEGRLTDVNNANV